ncbi:ATP-dependent zinc metalloprotease FtsH [Halovibrio sp. HP20-50]|uniref:ATP-dependent zinc metalloprotease FtsH n=1 Tax=Halovibrio sp. HP20-59 TaxID=3080275 RepID=UPI00294AA741|nr:ATP-dependent zinc metalloprotease FtsH [Halovibrio sp. HP20-59]MEA2118275.1 ATP-dependent zinc metalloprotease FtsH [Halovibrio sp. HP20-59]
MDPFSVRKPPQGKQSNQWALFVWMTFAILLLFYYLQDVEQQVQVDLAYSDFLSAVENGHIDEVTLRGQSVEGSFTEAGREAMDVGDADTFETTRPVIESDRLLERLEQNGIQVAARPVEPPWWQQILVRALPWILILGLLFWFWGRMQQRMMAGGGGLFNMGKSQARQVQSEDSDVLLADVAGSENAKREVTEVIDFLKHPERYRSLGARIPRGVLMMGPPGTGKTLLGKAVAGEAEVPFFSISGSEFIEMFVGVGASRVRDLFKEAKKQAPSVVFIDELDSIGRSRGAGMGGGHDEREQTLNQILAELDGFEKDDSVVVLAATNRPDVLDKALLRPGRFDRKVTLENPNRHARQHILEVHTRKMPLADDVNLERLASMTVGFSGADLANLANEAALQAGRRQQDTIDWRCFSDARDRELLGQAKDVGLSDEEHHIVAYHEAGHALLAYLLPKADPLEKVTVLPRSQALGVTAQMPDEERHNLGEAYLRDRITVMFGGRLAESIVFDEVSSGAENDIEQATQTARRMVGRWGMNHRIGPVAFAQSQEHVFLGKELGQPREFGDATASLVDEEVRELLNHLEDRGRKLLKENRQALDALASALEERETLETSEIHEVLQSLVSENDNDTRPER